MLRSFEEKIFAHRFSQGMQQYLMYCKFNGWSCGEKDSFKTVSIPMRVRPNPSFFAAYGAMVLGAGLLPPMPSPEGAAERSESNILIIAGGDDSSANRWIPRGQHFGALEDG